ncbi:hypothetical protein RYX56_01075 [Alkalihalophilus lindianensis]|uniref:Uncharacterized protein n=1 Tax=Alkalihalophilus lindianensis TaxID=1630542 RepID=A0ABU3X4Y5_9BACI|nr:hypothetical protein [Alkalihalophilus lindianensis]MDV2682958.1 hypothetical protein [Alkalihalophilus lindianensis]
MKKNLLVMLLVLNVAVLVAVFLLGTQSYFHSKEVQSLTEGCREVGGTPLLEIDTFVLAYSFSCEK